MNLLFSTTDQGDVPPASPDISVKGRRVVVVDDKEGVRLMLQKVLEAHGIEVHLAPDALSAIALIRQQKPDLILSDINMDGLDGFELLAHVRKDSATAQLPFVLMTGKADLRGMRNGMSLGADDYLPKPFSNAELIDVLKRRFERQEVLRSQAESRLTSLRSNIATMLPHELLTPLNGIMGVGSLLEAGDVSHEDLAAYAEMLLESAERLHRTILNFLTLAQLELLTHDPAGPTRIPAEGSSTADEWLPSVALRLAAKHDRSTDLALTVPRLHVGISSQDLSKVIEELLDNAFKFSAPGSRVELRGESEGLFAMLTVQDHGRGMDREQFNSIGAFQQFDRKLHEQQGSGLGAIIAKRLVELHGGTFSIESVLGSGTTVRISLPLRGAV